MSDDRWPRVKEVLAAALEASADQRPALVHDLCVGDPGLRASVEELLAAHAMSTSFLEEPLITQIDFDEAEPNLGRKLGPYVIEEAIGRGGMGTVYVARRVDEEFERRVAIKMIRRGMDSDVVIRRFRHERQILASLNHPNIAALFDGGTTSDGLPYFVMEYVSGLPIDRYADEHRLTTTARIELCLPVLDAVQHAHDRLVVHRDIKPTNVMVTADGHPKLLDFGIAKILDPEFDQPSTFTSLGRPMTPEYASPEQLRGDSLAAASDVYSLGLLLYELLTGRRPYRLTTRTPEEIARVVAEQDPERPSAAVDRVESDWLDDDPTEAVTAETISLTRDGSPALLRRRLSGTLDEILLKALRKEPEQRYASVAALAGDLRRYLAEQPVALSWEGRRYRARRMLRRHRTAVATAALVLVVAGAAAVATRKLTSRQTAVATQSAQTAARPSLAVVGFRNLSERAGDAWMATAVAEMLTTELGGDGQLRVLPSERVSRVQADLNRNAGASAITALSAGSVERIRGALSSDYAVAGTIAVSEGAAPRAVRVDVRIQRAGRDPLSVAAAGDEGQLFALVANVGRELRTKLGLHDTTPENARSARAAFPQTPEATRLYAEGMSKLRLLDAVSAKSLLDRAAAREGANPMIQTALASAWTSLGYDKRAVEAAKKAFDASTALSREDRLNVEGRLYEVQRKWPNAVDVYRTLWGFFSDNVEYGLRLAAAQTAAGQPKESLKTVAALRQLRAPENQDPRIDLEEFQANDAIGDFQRGSSSIQQAVQRAEHSGARLVLARARWLEGRSDFNRGQLGPAQQALDQAQRVYLEVGDRAGAAAALNSLAVVLADQQDLSQSERMYRQALAVAEEIGDRRTISAALNNMGILLKDERRFDEARQVHERALAVRREISDQAAIALSLGNIGVVLFEQDRLREAGNYYRQSLAIVRDIDDRRGQVRALHNIAIIDRELGNLTSAHTAFAESLAAREKLGDKRGLVMGRVELGAVQLLQGELERARKTEESALALAREISIKSGEGQALYRLGDIALASGDFASARRVYEQSLAIRREMKETRTVLESRLALAALTLEEGRTQEAMNDARHIQSELGSGSDQATRIGLAVLLARGYLALGAADDASRALAVVRVLAQKTEQIEPRELFVLAEANVDAAQGQTARARERLTMERPQLARAGMALAALEFDAALLALDRAEERPTFKVSVDALEKNARALGAGLILRRLRDL
jgi:serine/threonine protein kinase/tetratricopeptide (TPR) repeat protein/TolB-like protein